MTYHHTRPVRVLGIIVGSILISCGGLSCSSDSDEPTDSEGAASEIHDLDLDPELLAELDAKSDGDPCANYPGGPLGGDDLLVLVNKDDGQKLKSDYAPNDLFPLESAYNIPGRKADLRRATQIAVMDLVDAAATEQGFEIRVRSAYRSYRTQCFTFAYWVRVNGFERAFRYSAQPGRSQHQLGTTADVSIASLGWKLTADLALTPEGAWLAGNAARFGFALSYPKNTESVTGYGFEPWHFRYIGRQAALELETSGEILETYLQRCQKGDSELLCPREPAPELEPNEGFIGGRCEEATDCSRLGPHARCLTGKYTEGMCALPCTRSCPDQAGPNAVTFCVAMSPSQGMCHSRCDFDLFPEHGCRQSYVCAPTRRPDGSGPIDTCQPTGE